MKYDTKNLNVGFERAYHIHDEYIDQTRKIEQGKPHFIMVKFLNVMIPISGLLSCAVILTLIKYLDTESAFIVTNASTFL